MPGRDALVAHVRVTHPFPSVLDGLVASGAALAAGGAGETALRLGVSMVLLQGSVGALNDLIDAPRDAGHKPGKPIPAGLVRPAAARVIAALAAVSGVVLAMPSGPTTVVLAAGLLGLGYAYDLWFKGTAWSWLPFAIAIPLFPTYGWLGASGSLPAIWAILVPAATLAGTALALGNAAIDVERDRAAGIASVATMLGRVRAAAVNLVLVAVVGVAAVTSLVLLGRGMPWGIIVAAWAGLAVGGAALIFAAQPARRERGWKVEAVGIALLAVTWLVAVSQAGGVRSGG